MDVGLLGPLVVVDDGRRLAIGGPKERAVFAALALRVGHVVPVDDLLDMLWPAAPPASAAKTLQSYVSKVRRVVGHDVVATHDPGYELQVPSEAVDIVRFDRLVEMARAAAASTDHRRATATYADALALWRGRPLPDLAPCVVGQAEIERLSELRLTVVEELVESRLALGEHHHVIPDLEALVTEAPLRERPRYLLMLALYRAGRQTDALRHYQRTRALLIDRIGVEPSATLRELEASIIAQDPRLDLTPVSTPTPGREPRLSHAASSWPRRGDYPFAGRAAELAKIDEIWQAVAADERRRAVLVGGEPGIGKTRLVAEAARRARDEGALVLYGRCEEGLAAPYQPFVEALGPLMREGSDELLDAATGPLSGELTRLFPELATRRPQFAPPISTEPDIERHRLFEAMTELLEQLGNVQPVLLVLDDLQWAAQPTLLLARHLVTAPRPARLMVAGTYRSAELVPSSPLADVLADLRRHGNVWRLGLAGLGAEETVRMAVAAADQQFDPGEEALIRRIHRESAGNPFFFWELVMHLVETGMIVHLDGRWTNAPDAFERPLPESIREVVELRLAGLDEQARTIVRVAAVVGSQFDYRVVAVAAGVAEDEVVDALDLAHRAGALAERRGAFGTYVFTHDLVRRSLVEELSTTRRVRLHWRIADALDQVHGDGADAPLAQLAHHCTEGALAGDPKRARGILQRAGDAAMDALGFEEAASYYDNALGLAELDDPDATYELLVARGRALQRAGNPDYTDAFKDAIALARSQDDPDRLAEAVLGLPSHPFLRIGSFIDHDLEALLEEAIAGLGARAPALVAQLTSNLALTVMMAEHRHDAVELSASAVELARSSGDARVLADVLIDHIWVITGPDTVAERMALAREVTSLAEGLDDQVTLVKAYNCLNLALIEAGELDRGTDVARDGLARAEYLRQPMLAWGFRVHLAAVAMLRADVATIERLAGELGELGSQIGVEPVTVAMVRTRLELSVRLEQGRLGEVEESLRALVADHPQIDWMVTLGVVYVEQGRLDEAQRIVELMGPGPARRDLTWMPLKMLTVWVVAGVRDRARAVELYDELLPFAGRNSVDGAGTCGPVDLGLGQLATVLGRWDDAGRHFDDARQLCLDWKAPMWAARTALEHAEMGARSGLMSRDEVLDRLDECAAEALQHGQLRLLERVATLRDAL